MIAPTRPLYAAMIVVVVIETAIGGRVIPMFTQNALRGVKTVSNPRIDKIALASTAAAGAAWAFALPALVTAALALVGAAVLWSAAFILCLLVYGPWLSRPRIDGREG